MILIEVGMASSTRLLEVNCQISNPTENLRDSYGQSVAMRHDNLEKNLDKIKCYSKLLRSNHDLVQYYYNLKMTPKL
jgi:hypothetical protein